MRSARSQSGISPSCCEVMRRASHICGRYGNTPERNRLTAVAIDAMLASMQTTGEDLIGATEAAEILGVSKDTLIRMITRGDLTASKLPGANGVYLLNGPQVREIAATRKGPVRSPGRPRRHQPDEGPARA